MNKATGFILLCAAVGGGYAIGRLAPRDTPADAEPRVAAPNAKAVEGAPKAPPRPAAAMASDVFKVEVGSSPVKGGKQPKVTIIEFSEFQCPFCGRVGPTLKQIMDTYKDDVQVAFKHMPLPFHPNALPAAQAAMAAHEQGKFWEMHDKLFANQQNLDRPSLEKYAQEISLDMGKFKAALDSGKFKSAIEADAKYGQSFGATGTPSFFVNGRSLVGAQPFESFKAVIDAEIEKADAKLKAGVPRGQLYAALIKDGADKAPERPAAPPARPAARPGSPDPSVVYRAEIAGAPVKGAKDALITIVQFSDYQCPFCSRVEPTIDKVMEEYKGKVRVVWRDLPLPFHPNAMPGAIATRAAGEQGKFWQMHDKLFANQQNLDRPSLEKYAQELGLNMGKFNAALDQQTFKAEIEADSKMGNKIGANGTPAFFINGTFLSGAQPFEAFKARIDEQLVKAEALVKAGTPKTKVYDVIMKDAKTEVQAAPAAAAAPEEAGPENDKQVFKVDIGKSASKGPKSAPLTVVVFSDFQCPFCSRVEPTLKQLEKEYPGKVRIVWKNYPLPFHQNAKPAAVAAFAAGDQGKFWEMHDKLFENQQQLDRPNLEKYAQDLGLNMAKFKAALDSTTYSAQIEAEKNEGSAAGVNGTPATFINGRKISGAYPYPTFKKIADEELAKIRKGS